MKQDYTHITVILDRSGSMEAIRDDVIAGFNKFLKEGKATPGLATLTLVQFDTENPYEVLQNFALVQAVPKLTHGTYVPRGGTPLLDAMGRGINELAHSIGTMRECDRPARVVVMVVTDGQENSSRVFRRDQIASMIAEKQEMNLWEFVFLSADINAVNDAVQQYNFRPSRAMAFDKNAQGSHDAFQSVSANVRAYREATRSDMSFTEEDRSKQSAEKNRK